VLTFLHLKLKPLLDIGRDDVFDHSLEYLVLLKPCYLLGRNYLGLVGVADIIVIESGYQPQALFGLEICHKSLD
jgi:hypothetical protein